MGGITYEDHSTSWITKISTGFGACIVLVLVVWVLLNNFSFNWRPFTHITKIIYYSLKSERSTFISCIFSLLWYIFYFIPFILLIVFGLILAFEVKPYSFGTNFAIAIPALIGLFAIFQYFRVNGFSIKIFGKLLIFLFVLLIIAAPVVALFAMDELSWMGSGYIFCWPSLVVFSLLVVIRRKRIFNVDEMEVPDSDDFREKIETSNIKGIDKFSWYDYVIVVIVSALVSVAYYFAFKGKEDETAALATAILFFGIDIFVLFTRGMKNDNVATLVIALVAIVLKAVSVTFSRRFWFIGHGVIFLFVFSYMIEKFAFDFWCSKRYKILDIQCEQVVDNLVLMTHGKNRVELGEVIYEGIVLAVLLIAMVVDGILTRNLDFESLSFGISQQNLTLYLETLSLSVGLAVAALRIIYQLNGHVDMASVLLIISSFVLSLVLTLAIPMKGATTIKAATSVTLISVVCSLIILILTMFNETLYVSTSVASVFSCESYESEKVVFYSFVFGVISAILDAVFPFIIKDCGYLGFIIASCVLSVTLLVSFIKDSFSEINSGSGIKSLVFSVIFAALFGVFSGLMKSFVAGAAAFVALCFVECIIFSLTYTRIANWDSSIFPILFIIVPSGIIAVGSLVYTILADSVVLPTVLLFVFTALFFGSLIYAILKKNDYEFSTGSMISIAIMCLCLLAVIVYVGVELKDAFLLITIICGAVFAVCFVVTIAIIVNSSGSNSLVFTEMFFPIFTYEGNGIANMKTLNFLFVVSQLVPYLWGLFGTIFFSEPQFGFLGVAFSLGFMFIFGCLLICYSNSAAMFALEYASKKVIEEALDNVKSSDAFGEVPPEEIDFSQIHSADDLRKMIDIISAGKKASKRHLMVFNAQLSVSAQVDFEFTKNYLYNKFKDQIVDLEYLKENSNWSAKERLELIRIYDEVKKQDTDEQAALMYYEYVEAQARERMKLLNERDNSPDAETIILPPEIDPDAAALISAQQQLQNIRDKIREKELEQYKLQKKAEMARQEAYQRRLEEDKRRREEDERRRKEEEEERRKNKIEKDKIAAEKRRKEAEERRRREAEERRRREDEQNEAERRRLDQEKSRLEEERRRAEEEAARIRQRLGGNNNNNNVNGASEYTRALQRLLQANIKFVDPRFSPTMNIKENPRIREKLNECQWHRLEELQQSIMNNISPTRFIQGNIGDCYLVAAISSLARDPSMIEKIFEKPINNKAYISSVQFHRMGKVDRVAVDTLVPVSKLTGKPKFVHFDQNDDSYWPAIIEKAYAKYFGSYSAVQGGNSHTALYYLTGEFPFRINFDKDKWKKEFKNGDLWRRLKAWFNCQGYLCAGSIGGDDTDVNSLGIVQGHAYTIMGLYEINNTQLIKMRNTWGDTEWKGEWSDNDPRWTPELRRKLGVENKNDGVFFMPFRCLPTHFDTIYALIRTNGLHRYVLETTFRPGGNDGAKPNDRAELLTQWRFIFSQPTKMYILYEKNSCSSIHQVQMKKTSEKFKFHYVGDTVLHEGVVVNSEVSSWIWDISEINEPWFFLPYREAANDVVDVCIQVFTDNPVQCERFD